jgi:hypothetical protein
LTSRSFLAVTNTPAFRGTIFVLHAVATAFHWRNVLGFAQLKRDYPPEILAAVHFRTPPFAVARGAFMTAVSVFLFVAWYRSIPR